MIGPLLGKHAVLLIQSTNCAVFNKHPASPVLNVTWSSAEKRELIYPFKSHRVIPTTDIKEKESFVHQNCSWMKNIHRRSTEAFCLSNHVKYINSLNEEHSPPFNWSLLLKYHVKYINSLNEEHSPPFNWSLLLKYHVKYINSLNDWYYSSPLNPYEMIFTGFQMIQPTQCRPNGSHTEHP